MLFLSFFHIFLYHFFHISRPRCRDFWHDFKYNFLYLYYYKMYNVIVSILKEKPETLGDLPEGEGKLINHSTVFTNSQEELIGNIINCAADVLKKTYGDAFAGHVEDIQSAKKESIVTSSWFNVSDDQTPVINVWYIGEEVIKGWVTTEVKPRAVSIGYFTSVSVDANVELSLLQWEISDLKMRNADLGEENKKLEGTLDEMNKQVEYELSAATLTQKIVSEAREIILLRTNECDRLRNKISALETENNMYFNENERLRAEISLKNTQLTRAVNTSREFEPRGRERAKNEDIFPKIPDPPPRGLKCQSAPDVQKTFTLDESISLIRNFDRSTLRSMKNRRCQQRARNNSANRPIPPPVQPEHTAQEEPIIVHPEAIVQHELTVQEEPTVHPKPTAQPEEMVAPAEDPTPTIQTINI